MQEFSSISVSSYEAGSLAERLTEQSRDGWGVVAIVPTGSTVTAYLSRESSGVSEPAAAVEPVAEATPEPVFEVTPEPVVTPSASEVAATESIAAAAAATTGAAAAYTPEPVASSEAATSWSALAEEAAQAEPALPETSSISIPEVAVPEVIVPDVVSPVEEPAGWALSPESASATTAEVADPAAGLGAGSIAAAADQVVASVSEPVAAVAEPVVTQQVVTPAATPSAAPAGWYADPSSRYELRYWDGAQWTEHVSRGGQQFTDPPVA
jgi:Protein of unknown function (DUF2510)